MKLAVCGRHCSKHCADYTSFLISNLPATRGKGTIILSLFTDEDTDAQSFRSLHKLTVPC